jgi:hypothetical protein
MCGYVETEGISVKVIKGHVFARNVRGTKHNWEELLDGQQWQLDEEDMKGSNFEAFVYQGRKYAARVDKVLRVQRIREGDEVVGLIVQAVPADGEGDRTNGEPAPKKGKK